MSDAKLEKRPVDYSAGVGIYSLIPDDERVALVLNKRSTEVQVVPKEFLKKRRYKEALVEERENDAVVWFIQPDGFGFPFGKEEPEDGKDRVRTAIREAEEETGSPVERRVISSISYTEQPNYWSFYSNTVFPANGVGFSFQKDRITDEFVDPRFSAMWKLRRLPIKRRPKYIRPADEEDGGEYRKRERRGRIEERIGIYQATLRRIIATLLQLNDGLLLRRLGRPGAENAEDLVQAVIRQIPYRNFFSHRFLKMLSAMGRLDLALGRLRDDKGVVGNPELAAQMGANMILWLPYKPDDPKSMLNEMLGALVGRCDPGIRSAIGGFLVDRLERREKAYLVSLDRSEGLADSDEKEVVEEDEDEVRSGDRQFAEALHEKSELD